MFNEQYKVSAQEEKALKEICRFSVTIYIKYWFSAPIAVCVPKNNLVSYRTSRNIKQLMKS